MTAILVITMTMLFIAAFCALARMVMGPTMPDRAVALDVLVAVCICVIAVLTALADVEFTLPLLLVLTLLVFVGSVCVARFSPGSDDVEAERS